MIESKNENILFKINLNNTQYHAIYFRKYKNGYEPDVLSLINLLLPKNGVFYDVGSNWGIFSIYALCSNTNNRIVYSFDAQEEVLKDLITLKKEYAHTFDRLNVLNIALGSIDDEVVSFESLDSFHSGLFRRSLSKKCIQLPTRILDNLNIKKPDLIKVDIEGMEVDFLAGAKNLIFSNKPYIIVENPLNVLNKKNLIDLLNSFDYIVFGLYVISGDGSTCILQLNQYKTDSIEKNVLCIHRSKLHEFNDLINGSSSEIDLML